MKRRSPETSRPVHNAPRVGGGARGIAHNVEAVPPYLPPSQRADTDSAAVFPTAVGRDPRHPESFSRAEEGQGAEGGQPTSGTAPPALETVPTTEDRRWRTAIHEAAHFVIGDRVGIPLGVVSIRPTTQYGGVCDGRYAPGFSELDPSRLLIDQPARARRAHEANIRWRLAGPAADRLYFPSTSFVRTPRPIEPATMPHLSPAAATQLIHLERAGNAAEPGTFVHDEDAALHSAYVLVGRDLSSAYYQWAVADTSAMVVDDSGAITRLAEALMERDALSVRDARAAKRRKAV